MNDELSTAIRRMVHDELASLLGPDYRRALKLARPPVDALVSLHADICALAASLPADGRVLRAYEIHAAFLASGRAFQGSRVSFARKLAAANPPTLECWRDARCGNLRYRRRGVPPVVCRGLEH